ncbi:hypothetical protein ACFU0X_10310 [Streptomyces cellulosae]|uniref:Nitroreductase domain-containing protein n=1 Tax=Streptomyces cellulosae TaxID=1968 RepID=A0ABW6JDI8_STRCE
MTLGLFRRHPAMLVSVVEIDGAHEIQVSVRDGDPPLLVVDARLLTALSVLPAGPFTFADAQRLWFDEGLGALIKQLWEFCRSTEMVLPEEVYAKIGPHAEFHGATRTYPFLAGSPATLAADERLRLRRDCEATGSTYCELDRLSRHALLKAENVGRWTPKGRLSVLEEVSLIVDGTFGERLDRTQVSDGPAQQVFKAVPSGGGRHPTELLVFMQCDKFPTGQYHYNVASNSLDYLTAQPGLDELEEMCPALIRALVPSPRQFMVVQLACRIERTMCHYQAPQALRAIALDVGHAMQHMAELAHGLGWQWADLTSFNAAMWGKRLALNIEIFPLLAMGVLIDGRG